MMNIGQYIQELDKNEDKKRIINEHISKAKKEQEFKIYNIIDEKVDAIPEFRKCSRCDYASICDAKDIQ